MLLSLLFKNPFSFLIAFALLIFSLTIHEFCHALAADTLGDPTARLKGRLSLNPLAHLDPLGTIALLLAGFGWAKPVPVDPYNFENPLRDMSLVALAGPASNFAIAIVFALIFRAAGGDVGFLNEVIVALVQVNLILGIFNFVPVAPLDGSKIILAILPKSLAYEFEKFMHQYGMIVLLALILPWYQGLSPISFLIGPVISFFTNILLFI